MSQQRHIDELFEKIWDDYLLIAPSALSIHALLNASDEATHIVNDHIALRTLNFPHMGISALSQHFEALGYKHGNDYDFSDKSLNAMHFEHPNYNHPKVFISELKVEELSDEAQTILHGISESVTPQLMADSSCLFSGKHWQLTYNNYQVLLAESEYAAWFAAWGFRANHFTVSVNHLETLTELVHVNELLKQNGFVLNTSGGEIKGSEEVCLAQSSTMADKMPVAFSDRTVDIPSCFYEFAQRYPLPNGDLYQGFVAASANKIFESTHVK
jgi:hypothetical protein